MMTDDESIEDKIEVTSENKEQVDKKHPLKFLDDYFPDSDEIELKGRLEQRMIVPLSTVNAILEYYPEISDMEGIINEWVKQIEKRMVSVDGLSRDEYKEIMIALLGQYKLEEHTDEKDSSFLKNLFEVDNDE